MSEVEIQINKEYQPSTEKGLGNYTMIPSSKANAEQNATGIAKRDQSGLQASGFDPHGPQEMIIDPEINGGIRWRTDQPFPSLTGERPQPDPQPVKAAQSPAPADLVTEAPQPHQATQAPQGEPQAMQPIPATPNQPKPYTSMGRPVPPVPTQDKEVFITVPGMLFPLTVKDYRYDEESGTLFLVTELSRHNVPQFNITNDGEHIGIKLTKDSEPLRCVYIGQSLDIDNLHIDVLMVDTRY